MPILPRRLRRTTKVLRMVHERRNKQPASEKRPRAAGVGAAFSFFF